MRIKRNYLGAVKNFFGWFLSRFKPLTVHTEAVMDDDCWKKIQEKVRAGSVKKWYLMTPENHEYYKSSFNIKLPKKELSNKMKERYLWMKKNNQNLQLHIHISLLMKNMPYSEQENLFEDSLKWMQEELGIIPSEFVPGWWSYNKDTLRICKKFRLKMIYPKDYDYAHDYEWAL